MTNREFELLPMLLDRGQALAALGYSWGTVRKMIDADVLRGVRPKGCHWYRFQKVQVAALVGLDAGRVNLPSYMKDLVSMAKHPLTTVGHALNPLLAAVSDMLQNRDFYDTRIFNPDDPLLRRLKDRGLYLGREFTPFSVSGVMKLAEDGAPLHKQVLPFFGIVPAPQRNVMSPAETFFAEQMAERMPKQARTREQFDRSKLIKELVTDWKAGGARREGVREKFRSGIEQGSLTSASAQTMIERLKYSPLQFQAAHVDATTAMRGWRMATPAERAQLMPIIVSKVANSKSVPDAMKQAWLEELAPGQ